MWTELFTNFKCYDSSEKIEEYEFAEQLVPEEKDNICRIIGKFAYNQSREKDTIGQLFYLPVPGDPD